MYKPKLVIKKGSVRNLIRLIIQTGKQRSNWWLFHWSFFQVVHRILLKGSADDTAANWIKFKCRRPRDGRNYDLWTDEKGFWGKYGNFSGECPLYSAICGLSVKFEEYRGIFRDDTALNDVKFHCCRDCCHMNATRFKDWERY